MTRGARPLEAGPLKASPIAERRPPAARPRELGRSSSAENLKSGKLRVPSETRPPADDCGRETEAWL